MKEKGGIPFIHVFYLDEISHNNFEVIPIDIKVELVFHEIKQFSLDKINQGGLFLLVDPVLANDFETLKNKVKLPGIWAGFASNTDDQIQFKKLGINHLIFSWHEELIQKTLLESFVELSQKVNEINYLIEEIELRHLRYLECDSKLKLLSSTVNEPIVFIDQDQNITLWNKEAQRFFGYTKYEIRNEKFLRWIVAERSHQDVIHLFRQANLGELKKSNSDIPLFVKNKLGVEFEIKASVSIQRKKKKGFNLVFVFHDIQKSKKLDREIIRNRELWDETKILKEFIHNVTHELRTPMNSIIGIAKALQKYNANNLQERQREGLQIILSSGNQMIALIKDLLDIARIDKNKIELNYENFNIDKFLSHQKSQALNLIEERPIRLIIKKSPSVPSVLYADQRKIFQVLTNLVGNATKFTKQGKITISCHYLNNKLFFEVADTGIGIRSEKQKEIFQKFNQADSTFSSIGTGLGLHISKKLVQLMHGEISLESEFEKGTLAKFSIQLPNQPIESEQSITNLKKEAFKIIKFIPGKKLFIAIDDNSQNQFIYNLLSERKDYNFILAKNGKTGLHAVNNLNPDLVIVRLEVPEIHGTSIIKSINHIVPCIAVSSFDTSTLSNLPSSFKPLFEPIDLEDLTKSISGTEFKAKWPTVENLVIFFQESNLKNKLNNKSKYIFINNNNVDFTFVQICQLKPRYIIFEFMDTDNNLLLLKKLLGHAEVIRNFRLFLIADGEETQNLQSLVANHKNLEIVSQEKLLLQIKKTITEG